MGGWNEGYVTDVVYTSNFFRETTPAWLAAAALLLGHRPPDLSLPFRYADLGCGHGLTAIIVAATCPHAEVWGFDFNPAHVESARNLASRAGLTNVRFQETSFAELAALPASALPEFDFMVSHGVMSWVAQENQRHLVQVIGQHLRPGGLAYLSYNVATGWGAMPPLRTLMRLLMRSTNVRSDRAASSVLDHLDAMKQAGAHFFTANPLLVERLAEIRKQDPRYIAHEFLNQDWHPLMFADVAERMSEVKCSYIGSAALTENIDLAPMPKTMMTMIKEAPDRVLQETLRDFAAAQVFRRDIYRRGVLPIPGPEHAKLLDALRLEWLGRMVTDPITLSTPLGTMQGLPEVNGPLVEMLKVRASTIGEIRSSAVVAGRPVSEVLQAVMILMSGGYLHPTLPSTVQTAARASTHRLNMTIGTVNASGGDIVHLASPVIGSALNADLLETLIVQEKAAGLPMEVEGLVGRLLKTLTTAGRPVQHDGKSVTDGGQADAVLRDAVKSLLENRLPLLERLAIVAP